MFERVRSLLGARDWRFLLAAWTPVILLLVALKIARIVSLSSPVSIATFGTLVRSELFFALAVLVAGIGLLRAAPTGGWLHTAARLILTTLCGLAVLTNGLAHAFYRATGSLLTWPLVRHGWKRLDELYGMIGAGTSLTMLAAIGGLAGALQIVPWLLASRFASDPAPAGDDSTGRGLLPTGLCFVIASVLASVAWIPAAWLEVGSAFAREPTLHLATTAASSAPGSTSDRQTQFTLRPPVSSSLRPTEDDGGPENLVVIILESTRARSTTIHNPELETTPFLADLASNSQVMSDAYTVLPHTSKALVSIQCGIPPMPRLAIVEARPGHVPARCLPELLGEHGYRSVFFQTATKRFENREQLVSNFGFDDFYALEDLDTDRFRKVNYLGYEEAALLGPSRHWLKSHGDEPFFATYLTLSPHHDYQFSDRWGTHQFSDQPKLNRYLNAIRYVDRFVEKLITQYRELGLYDETTFFILADHGEAFGEHRVRQHDNVPYQEGLRIPWLIHAPGNDGSPSGTVERRVSLLDVLPTAVRRLGFELIGGANYPGRPVSNVSEKRMHFFSCFYDDTCLGALYDDYKFVHHYDRRPDELFDLARDPREQQNLSDERPNLTGQLRTYVRQWETAVERMYRNFQHEKGEARTADTAVPDPAQRRPTRLGAGIEFVGYDASLADDGETLHVRCVFERTQRPDAPLALQFVVRSENRTSVIDGDALNGLYRLDAYRDRRRFAIELTFKPPGAA
ncbi:MAG: LTA synthase family protein, partial [Bradymonadaceae bacterium]